jgi:hypothetical protein
LVQELRGGEAKKWWIIALAASDAAARQRLINSE